MKVKYLNFIEQWREEKRELLPVLLNVLDSGQYVGVRGKEITRFEKRVSKECKMKYAVALNSGTDARTFALHSVGVKRGDEVLHQQILLLQPIIAFGCKTSLCRRFARSKY